MFHPCVACVKTRRHLRVPAVSLWTQIDRVQKASRSAVRSTIVRDKMTSLPNLHRQPEHRVDDTPKGSAVS